MFYFNKKLRPRLVRSTERIDCHDDTANETVKVDIQSRNQFLRLSDLLNGSIKIDFDRTANNHVLLKFANDQSNEDSTIDEIDCWSIVSDSIIVSNVLGNETQTFCLMEKEAKTISPLDCLSILPRASGSDSDSTSDTVWLTEDDKALAIGLLVTGLILCLVLGFGIAVLIVKRQANAEKFTKQSVLTRPDLISSDWNNDKTYTDGDTISMASNRSCYVPAVNPSRFDLIKMRLEKAENPVPCEMENQYGLEDMPYSKV